MLGLADRTGTKIQVQKRQSPQSLLRSRPVLDPRARQTPTRSRAWRGAWQSQYCLSSRYLLPCRPT